ncbi:MAG: hypothetical protein IJ060_03875 [Oscillospiraceae bacterium]|nr:hypothetical protein [Oscillospiraceae bacterium]
MKNMQLYREISARVRPRAACREEILTVAEDMQSKKRRPVMRRICIGLAAAAVALTGTVVAVGAANDWNYQRIFTKYYSEKTGTQVQYDFSNIGMDINESVVLPTGTLTVESALVTPYAVCLSWNFAPNETVTLSDTDSWISIVNCFGTDHNAQGVGQADGTFDEQGVCHFTANLISVGDPFAGSSIRAYFIVSQIPSDTETGITQVKMEEDNYIMLEFSGSTEPGLEKSETSVHLTECAVKPCDADYISVSPLAVILADEYGSAVQFTPGDAMGTDLMETPCTVTAVYADGTELSPETVNYSTLIYTYNSEDPADIKGQRFYLVFKKPLETENLVAVRINGTEVPLT